MNTPTTAQPGTEKHYPYKEKKRKVYLDKSHEH